MHKYNKNFFDYIDNQSFESSKIILNEVKKLIKFKVKEDDVTDIVHPIYLDWLQDKNSPFSTHLFYFLPSLYKALKRRFLMLTKL